MREELLQEAFRKYGTPLYVFDLDILKEQTERIRAGFGPEINLCYAMKANPFLTGYMAQWSDRIEVCSMGEFRICRKLQVPPEKLFISGVMKKRDDIREILAYCGNRCAYTVESPLHFQYFVEWSEEHPEDGILRLYPRLTSGNQFGMDEDTVLEILKKAKELPGIEAEGIHYFSGTQKKNLKRHQKELTYLDEFLKKAAEEQIDVKCLEYGSGTAVPYFRDKTAETFEETGLKGLQDAVKAMQWKGHVTVELGRALAAMCGYYLTVSTLSTVPVQISSSFTLERIVTCVPGVRSPMFCSLIFPLILYFPVERILINGLDSPVEGSVPCCSLISCTIPATVEVTVDCSRLFCVRFTSSSFTL